MESVLDWLDAKPRGSRIGSLLGLALIPAVLVGVVSVVFAPAAPLAGCVAGAALFVAAYGWWHTVLDEDTRDRTDLKARFDIKPRRGGVGVALALWLVFVLLVGEALPGPIIGTVNVFVAISLYWIWRATPQEAADGLARWEAAQEAKKAAAEAAEGTTDDVGSGADADPEFWQAD